MTQAAPGWYDDGTGRLRWWDGAAWTGDVLDPAVAASSSNAAAAAPSIAAPEQPEEFPWMREAAERERLAEAGTAAVADPIRSLPVDRSAEEVDPVVAWARQQAAAQTAAAEVVEPRSVIVEEPRRPRRRRRSLPWVLGGVLGAVVLAGAGGAVLAIVNAPGGAVDASAASVVEAYNDLWAGGACDSTGSVGTSAFIADLGWDDCALLADSQRSFLQSYEDYRVTIEETVVQGGIAWVDTSERYTAPGSDEEQVDAYRYELVRDGDGWLIDSLSAR